MILLDIIGGIFSMAQQGIRVIRMNSWAPFTDNLAKTFLAIESIMFDIMFVVQHVLWYTDRSDPTLLAPLRTKMGDIGNRQNVPATHDEMIGFI